LAIYHIGKAILNDVERSVGAILFDPQQGGSTGVIPNYTRIAPDGTLLSPRPIRSTMDHNRSRPHSTQYKPRTEMDGEVISKDLMISADMVGCVIGRGGSFISHIRRSSGARLHISDDKGSENERTVNITGSEVSVNKALKLLYAQLANEKERRQSMENADFEE
jgi:heterogeneous nuclear rnp K-like protein 2